MSRGGVVCVARVAMMWRQRTSKDHTNKREKREKYRRAMESFHETIVV
jgi:hypothetical protein